MSMNQEVKAKWLTALRSGEYQQGRYALNESGTFCCLGVLCDLYSKETNTPWPDGHACLLTKIMLGFDTVLPDKVKDWAGLDSHDPKLVEENPDYENGKHEEYVSCLNDSGRTFLQIADLIEAQL